MVDEAQIQRQLNWQPKEDISLGAVSFSCIQRARWGEGRVSGRKLGCNCRNMSHTRRLHVKL